MVVETSGLDALYHVTSPFKAAKIIKENRLRLSLSETNASEKALGVKKTFYSSLARTPASGYIADRSSGLRDINEFVMFVFSRESLNKINNAVIKPVSYFTAGEDGRIYGSAREAEERFFYTKPNLQNINKHILEVRIFMPKDLTNFYRGLLDTLLIAKKKGIKVLITDNRTDFIAGRENPDVRKESIQRLIKLKDERHSEWNINHKSVKKKFIALGKKVSTSEIEELEAYVYGKSYTDLPEKARSQLYYINRGYGDSGFEKTYSSFIHNLRGARETEQNRFYNLLKVMKVKTVSDFMLKLENKWMTLYKDYNKKMEESYKEVASLCEDENIELALVKLDIPKVSVKEPWRARLQQWAKSKGFKAIGNGAYGKVFYSEKNPDIVIKVFSDKSYKFWYKIVKENGFDNPYYPKFKGSPVKIGDGLWAVRMEKLSPLESRDGFLISQISMYTTYLAKTSYGIEYLRSHLSSKDYKLIDSIKKEAITENLEELINTLLFALSKGENSLKYLLDLHQGNFMRRGKQLVLVDPLQPISDRYRKSFSLPQPSTIEDASLMKPKYDIFDILDKQKEKENNKSETAFFNTDKIDKRLALESKSMEVIIGPKDGRNFSVMYSEDARMFFPKKKG